MSRNGDGRVTDACAGGSSDAAGSDDKGDDVDEAACVCVGVHRSARVMSVQNVKESGMLKICTRNSVSEITAHDKYVGVDTNEDGGDS